MSKLRNKFYDKKYNKYMEQYGRYNDEQLQRANVYLNAEVIFFQSTANILTIFAVLVSVFLENKVPFILLIIFIISMILSCIKAAFNHAFAKMKLEVIEILLDSNKSKRNTLKII